MTRRRNLTPLARDRILVARLQGAAKRHTATDTTSSRQEALDELREITPRPDLLGQAAGAFVGSPGMVPMQSAEAAKLLQEAGADPEVTAAMAAEVRTRVESGISWWTR